VDDRDWETYQTVFTPDAVIDDTVTSGIRSGVEERVAFEEGTIENRESQHAISTTMFDIAGDEAKLRTHCSCPPTVVGDG
jgi:hypothetical protein